MTDRAQAEAVLLSLDIPCGGHAFHSKNAATELLDCVEKYFRDSIPEEAHHGIRKTTRPPLFLQRPAHSITIVGIERLRSGKRRLLTFDPQWQPPTAMQHQLAPSECTGWSGQALLWRYRKSTRYLRRYQDFEVLMIE